MKKRKKIRINGMHCASCELLLEKEIKEIKSIKKCEASHKKGELIIETDGKLNAKQIRAIIKKCGYKIRGKNEKKEIKKKNKPKDYYEILGALALVIIAAFMISKLEITRYFPDFGEDVGILIALLVGFVASISSCLVLVGGIVMSFGNMYPVDNNKANALLQKTKPHIFFHLGRVLGFFMLGGILGLIGSKINYSLSFTGYLTVLISVLMFYLGLQILNLVPNISRFQKFIPKKTHTKIEKLQNNNKPYVPAIIGALTFFLPCGFTQSMQIVAMSTGSFLGGAMIMGAFALGTLPVLFSIGLGSTYAKKEKFTFAQKFIGIIVLFFAIYSFNSGLVLAGHNSPLSYFDSFKNLDQSKVVSKNSIKNGDNDQEKIINEKYQVVKMNVDYVFKPTEFKVKKGVPVRWEINGINITGCSDEVVIPKLGISSGKLKPGLNVVEFTPTETGVLPFSCWMGMLNGKFIVTDDAVETKNVIEKTNTANVASLPKGNNTQEKIDPNNKPSSCNGSCGGGCSSSCSCTGR